MNTEKENAVSYEMDPVHMAVLSNRINAIVAEMTNTLLRTARSAVLAVVRDFSCSIITADNQLLCPGDGLPIHIFGSPLQGESMTALHTNLKPGDAFLDNDPYAGNTHAADHMVMVPVIIDGVHLFTTCAKAHMADCGNSIPSTYHAYAKDVYEEGALIFPCVKIQDDYQDVDDIIRMCKRRIRVPEQWYGDYLAQIGSARIGERRLIKLVERYGIETIQQFMKDWFSYSERRMTSAIKKMPSGKLTSWGHLDPLGTVLPEGLDIRVDVDIDSDNGKIEVDLTKNEDNKDFGLNMTVATATSTAMAGVFNCLEAVPVNGGSFSRVNIKLRDGCITGAPKFPHSASMATTNVADRVLNATQAAFAQLSDNHGLAEGGVGMGAAAGVISGKDWRSNGSDYINQEWLIVNGGPASPTSDGWLNYGLPVAAGRMYRGSVEVDESKYPILFKSLKVIPGGGGAGKFRGGPGAEVIYGPRKDKMTVVVACDGQHFPPQGVRGGEAGPLATSWHVGKTGTEEKLPGVIEITLEPGEFIRGTDTGGGGYGAAAERSPEKVLKDVVEKWETIKRAEEVYGVAFQGRVEDGTLSVDLEKTSSLRSKLKNSQKS
jgi:N-methylhydantoinase B